MDIESKKILSQIRKLAIEKGVDNIHAHEMKLVRMLRDGLRDIENVTMYCQDDLANHGLTGWLLIVCFGGGRLEGSVSPQPKRLCAGHPLLLQAHAANATMPCCCLAWACRAGGWWNVHAGAARRAPRLIYLILKTIAAQGFDFKHLADDLQRHVGLSC